MSAETETRTGTVLFYMTKPDGKSFGFIEPDHARGNREANVWFAHWTLRDTITIRTGDRVEYEPGHFRDGKGQSAKSVWYAKDNDRLWQRHEREEIETLAGEFET